MKGIKVYCKSCGKITLHLPVDREIHGVAEVNGKTKVSKTVWFSCCKCGDYIAITR